MLGSVTWALEDEDMDAITASVVDVKQSAKTLSS